MARPKRLEYPGALWHLTNRGVEQRNIFLDEADRQVFLDLVSRTSRRYRWRVHQYCLMSNHFHLLSETLEPALSRGMQNLTGKYADYFNARYKRSGHLYKGRFDAQLVEGETYLLTVARYIVLNPVRARNGRIPCGLPPPHVSATNSRETNHRTSLPSTFIQPTIPRETRSAATTS